MRTRILTHALVLLAGLGLPTAVTHAATLTVTGSGEPAAIDSANCPGDQCPTLRDAINKAASGDTIRFAPALDGQTIALTLYGNPLGCVTSSATACSGSGTLGAQFGPSAFFISGRTLSIDAVTGLAKGVVIARSTAGGTAAFRLFDIAGNGGLNLSGVTLSNGFARGGHSNRGGGALGAGGAIFNRGALNLVQCTLVGHTAQGGTTVDPFTSASPGGGVGADASAYGSGNGGGPNGGKGGDAVTNASPGGFGGGGGGDTRGGVGGFGGGGGAGVNGAGNGGFGGGGGGYGSAGAGGFAGGNGRTGGDSGGGGGGLGGAIFNDAGQVSLSNVTLSGNSAIGGASNANGAIGGSGFGGALFNYNGTLTLDFVTVSGNTVAAGAGGGAADGGAIYSLADSKAACSAGGNTSCVTSGATLTLNHSIVANSSGGTNDLVLDVLNTGAKPGGGGADNAVGPWTMLHGATFSLGGMVPTASLGLPSLPSPLRGGLVDVMIPPAGSSAIDAVPCDATATDQRGAARPQGGACDAGAVEYRQPVLVVSVTGAGRVDALNGTTPVTGGIVACAADDGACTAAYDAESTVPTVTLGLTVADGSHVGSVDGCGGALDGAAYTIAALTANCTVTVVFAKPPVAVAQNLVVAFNTPTPITLSGNDGGHPNGALVYALVAGPTHGGISDFDPATGTLTYTPTLGFSGEDAFTFTVGNGNGTSAPATVDLDIAPGVPPVAQSASASVPYETAMPIVLDATDANPGGPFAFTYAIATPPAHGTIGDFDAAAGTLIYTPGTGYSGADGFTFTATTVNGTSLPATLSLAVQPQPPRLALSIGDDRRYARYGQIVDYTVSLTNTGGAAIGVSVGFSLSAGFDGDYARLDCYGAGAGASCTQDASDPLRFTVALPSDRSLTWRVGVPVRSDTQETQVTFGVSADGASPVFDTRTLVIYRDGFDTPYGDGTQSLPQPEDEAALSERP